MNVSFPSEKAIEDYIWSKLDDGEPCPLSDEHFSMCLRQKEIVGYGVTDIIKIGVYPGEVEIVVVELKNEHLKEAHISQLCRYITGIKRVVRLYEQKHKDGPNIIVRGELAGPFKKDRGDVVWLIESLENITVYDVSMSMDSGFEAKEISKGWFRSNEEKLGYRDITRQISNILDFHARIEMEEMHRHQECNNVVQLNGDRDA